MTTQHDINCQIENVIIAYEVILDYTPSCVLIQTPPDGDKLLYQKCNGKLYQWEQGAQEWEVYDVQYPFYMVVNDEELTEDGCNTMCLYWVVEDTENLQNCSIANKVNLNGCYVRVLDDSQFTLEDFQVALCKVDLVSCKIHDDDDDTSVSTCYFDVVAAYTTRSFVVTDQPENMMKDPSMNVDNVDQVKLLFDVETSSLRVGKVSDDKWDSRGFSTFVLGDDVDVHMNSHHTFASGKDLTHTGDYSTLFGLNNSTVCDYSLISGYNNQVDSNFTTVSGDENLVMGASNHVLGTSNDVTGLNNFVSGYRHILENTTDLSGAVGNNVTGYGNRCNKNYSFVSGQGNNNNGSHNSVVGFRNIVNGQFNVVGGENNILDEDRDEHQYSIVCGAKNRANGKYSAVFGQLNETVGFYNSVSGLNNNVFGSNCLVGGSNNIIERDSSLVSGRSNIVTGEFDSVHGSFNSTEGNSNLTAGTSNKVKSHHTLVTGKDNCVEGDFCEALGEGLKLVNNTHCLAIGSFNEDKTDSKFIIGNGKDESARSNCFRVDCYGNVYAKRYYCVGADYAEYFESVTQEPIPRGTVVSVHEGKVKRCEVGETPIGVISENASVVGNSKPSEYMTDEWGDVVNDEYGVPFQNPERYVDRETSPEWNMVGLLGKLYVLKNENVSPSWIRLREGECVDQYLVV